jgi:hypothetical protein
MCRVNVVKESLDIEEEEGGREAGRHCSTGGVDHRVYCVNGAVIIVGPELGGRENVVGVGVLYDVA